MPVLSPCIHELNFWISLSRFIKLFAEAVTVPYCCILKNCPTLRRAQLSKPSYAPYRGLMCITRNRRDLLARDGML